MRSLVLALALFAGGCTATVDIYSYRPRALPLGLAPLDAMNASLQQLKNVNWGYDPSTPFRRASVGADAFGIAASVHAPGAVQRIAPLYLPYRTIATHVRALTYQDGDWTVHLWTSSLVGNDEVELQFRSERAARIFLDAATALAARG